MTEISACRFEVAIVEHQHSMVFALPLDADRTSAFVFLQAIRPITFKLQYTVSSAADAAGLSKPGSHQG